MERDDRLKAMTRAERRRVERLQKKNEIVYTLTKSQLEGFRREIAKQYEEREKQRIIESSNLVFKLLLSLPVMALHDCKSEIKKNAKKHGAEEIFVAKIAEVYECYEKGLVTPKDLEECLYEETGIRFIDDNPNRATPKVNYSVEVK